MPGSQTLFPSALQDGNEVFFRIKRSTQLKKLMNAYCDRQSVDLNSIAFLFDGRRLRGDQTPDEVCRFTVP
jgi:small ubiquitin-related modifier